MLDKTKTQLWTMTGFTSAWMITISMLSGCSTPAPEENGQQDSSIEHGNSPQLNTSDQPDDSNVFLIENDEDLKRLWYPDAENNNILKEGKSKANEVISLSIQAQSPRMIGIATSVFWDKNIEWTEGHTIKMHQTNTTDMFRSGHSNDGLGFGFECEPVDGVIEIQVQNKSDKVFQYVIYEEKEAE